MKKSKSVRYEFNDRKEYSQMKDIEKEKDKTPIEVALQIDNDGTVSAKNVYEFLGLRLADYSRWCKINILESPFAEENVDYQVFRIEAENPKVGRPTTDYKLKVSFAKKLCMLQKNERGEQARNYFIKVEDMLKDIVKETPELSKSNDKSLEIKEKNARYRTANLYVKIANNKILPEAYRQIFLSYAGKELSGQEILPLPKSEQKTYSATEIGNIFGVSSQMIGKLANTNNLKTDEYGMFYHDKAKYSVKEVDTFRYFDTVIPKVQELLNKKV